MSSPPTVKPKRPLRHLFRKMRNWVAGLIGPLIVAFWIRTLRRRLPAHWLLRGRSVASMGHGVFVFWHQRLLGLAGMVTDHNMNVLISDHGDGELIARVIRGVGMKPVRGSTTRGGARALLKMLRLAGTEASFALTPDGPRGPRHEFQPGALLVASWTGLPIIPLTVSYRRAIHLPTWDGFQLPWPFTAMIIRQGEPLHVPRDATAEQLEEFRLEAERRLRALTESTDRDFEQLFRSGNLGAPVASLATPAAQKEAGKP